MRTRSRRKESLEKQQHRGKLRERRSHMCQTAARAKDARGKRWRERERGRKEPQRVENLASVRYDLSSPPPIPGTLSPRLPPRQYHYSPLNGSTFWREKRRSFGEIEPEIFINN